MVEGYILYEDAKTRFDNCIEGIDFYYNKRILHKSNDPKYYFVVDNQMPVPKEELLLEQVAK
jgi:hypothetical protein